MEEEKQELIKIINDCNSQEDLGLLKILMTEFYNNIKGLNLGKCKSSKNSKDSNIDLLDRHVRSFEDFPHRGGFIWEFVEHDLKIFTVRELINTPPYRIMQCRSMGKKRVKDLQEWLAKYNLKFIGT